MRQTKACRICCPKTGTLMFPLTRQHLSSYDMISHTIFHVNDVTTDTMLNVELRLGLFLQLERDIAGNDDSEWYPWFYFINSLPRNSAKNPGWNLKPIRRIHQPRTPRTLEELALRAVLRPFLFGLLRTMDSHNSCSVGPIVFKWSQLYVWNSGILWCNNINNAPYISADPAHDRCD